MISRFEILSGTDERNKPRNMSASEFTHWLLELRWLTDLNPHIVNSFQHISLEMNLPEDYYIHWIHHGTHWILPRLILITNYGRNRSMLAIYLLLRVLLVQSCFQYFETFKKTITKIGIYLWKFNSINERLLIPVKWFYNDLRSIFILFSQSSSVLSFCLFK